MTALLDVRYIDRYIKLNINFRCTCRECKNPELLFDALKRAKYLPEAVYLDVLVTAKMMQDRDGEEDEDLAGFMATLTELETGEDKKKPIQIIRWLKEAGQDGERPDWGKKKETRPLGEVAQLMATDFENLAKHLARNKEIKTLIKEKRLEAMDTVGLAVLHVDWGENWSVKVMTRFDYVDVKLRYRYSLLAADGSSICPNIVCLYCCLLTVRCDNCMLTAC